MMSNEEAAQQYYMQFQQIQQHIKQTQHQMEGIEQHMMEAVVAKNGIDELEKAKIGDELLVPLTSGIFIKASLLNNSEVLMNVGSRTVVTKDFKKARKLLEGQIEEMQKVQKNLGNQLQQLIMQARAIEHEMQKVME